MRLITPCRASENGQISFIAGLSVLLLALILGRRVRVCLDHDFVQTLSVIEHLQYIFSLHEVGDTRNGVIAPFP